MTTRIAKGTIAEVMNQMPYGLYIIGSKSEVDVNGMLADWVMQVSFNPRLIAVALENDAHTLENIRSPGHFTVNFLSSDNESVHLAAKFAQPYFGSKIKGRDRDAAGQVHRKLDDIPYRAADSGCPVLEQAMAWLECQAEAFIPIGDHTLVIGRVMDGGILTNDEPLTSSYTGWTYSG
jgi:flavin reductase (DIM6/NTAB) family NADH-FMN oxidoreductase RutF